MNCFRRPITEEEYRKSQKIKANGFFRGINNLNVKQCMYIYYCEYCQKTFQFMARHQSGAHKLNCNLNPRKKQLMDKRAKIKNQVKQQYILNCKKCNKEYIVVMTSHIYQIGKYKKFCSRSCANSRISSKQTKIKQSKSLKMFNQMTGKKRKLYSNHCNICKEIFYSKDIDIKSCGMCRKRIGSSMGGKKSMSIQAQNRRSKNQKYFAQLCKQHFKYVQYNVSIFNGWDADVIIHDIKVAVLWNGKWHYEKITKKHSVQQVQNRDKIKIKQIYLYGYTPYIIKDLGKFNKMFVEQKFNEFILYHTNNGTQPKI